MAYRDDVVLAYECADLGVFYLVAFQACGLQHNEDLALVDMNFRQLGWTHRVLDRQSMEPKSFLQDSEITVDRVKHFSIQINSDCPSSGMLASSATCLITVPSRKIAAVTSLIRA
jgi:hypothetical protein